MLNDIETEQIKKELTGSTKNNDDIVFIVNLLLNKGLIPQKKKSNLFDSAQSEQDKLINFAEIFIDNYGEIQNSELFAEEFNYNFDQLRSELTTKKREAISSPHLTLKANFVIANKSANNALYSLINKQQQFDTLLTNTESSLLQTFETKKFIEDSLTKLGVADNELTKRFATKLAIEYAPHYSNRYFKEIINKTLTSELSNYTIDTGLSKNIDPVIFKDNQLDKTFKINLNTHFHDLKQQWLVTELELQEREYTKNLAFSLLTSKNFKENSKLEQLHNLTTEQFTKFVKYAFSDPQILDHGGKFHNNGITYSDGNTCLKLYNIMSKYIEHKLLSNELSTEEALNLAKNSHKLAQETLTNTTISLLEKATAQRPKLPRGYKLRGYYVEGDYSIDDLKKEQLFSKYSCFAYDYVKQTDTFGEYLLTKLQKSSTKQAFTAAQGDVINDINKSKESIENPDISRTSRFKDFFVQNQSTTNILTQSKNSAASMIQKWWRNISSLFSQKASYLQAKEKTQPVIHLKDIDTLSVPSRESEPSPTHYTRSKSPKVKISKATPETPKIETNKSSGRSH